MFYIKYTFVRIMFFAKYTFLVANIETLFENSKLFAENLQNFCINGTSIRLYTRREQIYHTLTLW